MKNAEYTLDCLIVTINAAVDWTPYLAAMRANGAFVVLGAIPQPLEFPAFTLLMKNVSIQPTNIELEARPESEQMVDLDIFERECREPKYLVNFLVSVFEPDDNHTLL